MLTIIICIAAIYLLYTLFKALFGSNTPRTPHSVSGSLDPSRRTSSPHETPLMAQQQSTHDNSHAAIAGLTGALAGAALAHHLDQNAQANAANAAAQQQLATDNNTSAADDANMSYDDFMNTDRTYDDNGNVIDYDDNNDLSDDDDDSDDYDSDDDYSSDDSNDYDSNDYDSSDDYSDEDYSSDNDSWDSNDDSSFFGGGDDGGFFGGGDDGGDGGDWF